MLIALIGNSAQSVLSFRASLIRRLVDRGHRVQAYAPDYTSDTRAAVSKLGAEPINFSLQRSGTNPIADVRSILDLRRRLRRERPQAVLCYFIKPAIYGTIAAAIAGVPRRVVMLEGLGYGFAAEAGTSLTRRLLATAMKTLLRIALTGAYRTLVLNEDDRCVVVDDIGISKDKIVNMGGIGVELDSFNVTPVRDRAQTFALAARLIAEKGVRYYVEAARKIKTNYPDTRFLLLGEIDDNPTSLQKEEIGAWVEEGIVEWPGRVSDVQFWLKQSDVFVLPSYYREGVPRSIQEAMALGRAIITTDHVGCRDTVDHGITGYLVAIKNVDQIVDAMQQLIEKPGLAQKMGTAGRRLAEERFDAKRADLLIINLLETASKI